MAIDWTGATDSSLMGTSRDPQSPGNQNTRDPWNAVGNYPVTGYVDYTGGDVTRPGETDPAGPSLPDPTTSNRFGLYRPTDYSYGWNEAANAFGLVNNPDAMRAFVTGQFRGTPEEYFAQFGGGSAAPPMPAQYVAPTIPELPAEPEQGGFSEFYAAREAQPIGFESTGSAMPGGRRSDVDWPARFGMPQSRVVNDPLLGYGSFEDWQQDWQGRYDTEQGREGEGKRDPGFYGPTRDEYARQVGQWRGLDNFDVLLDAVNSRMDAYGPVTRDDFGALERRESDTWDAGWGREWMDTTTNTPSFGTSGDVQWGASTTRQNFGTDFNPSTFAGDVGTRQSFFGQRADAFDAPDWSDAMAKLTLGEEAYNDMMGYERPWDEGFAGFKPTFEILNEERGRLEDPFKNRQRTQQAYDLMSGSGTRNGLIPEGYGQAGYGQISGETNPFAPAMGAGQNGFDENSGISTDWLTGVYDPATAQAAGVYDPRQASGLGQQAPQFSPGGSFSGWDFA